MDEAQQAALFREVGLLVGKIEELATSTRDLTNRIGILAVNSATLKARLDGIEKTLETKAENRTAWIIAVIAAVTGAVIGSIGSYLAT